MFEDFDFQLAILEIKLSAMIDFTQSSFLFIDKTLPHLKI